MAQIKFHRSFSWLQGVNPSDSGEQPWTTGFASFTTLTSTASEWTVRFVGGDYDGWTVSLFPASGGFSIVSGSGFPTGVVGRLELRTSAGQLALTVDQLAALSLAPVALRDDPAALLSGADTYEGSSGQDRFRGGAGDDVLTGSKAGDNFGDILLGGDGADTLYGGPRGDTLVGEAGDDRIYMSETPDLPTIAYGGAGDDVITGGRAEAYGEGGDDYIRAVGILDGGDGDDTLIALAGSTLRGGAGDDHITGSDERDTISGGSGVNLVMAGGGDDLITVTGQDTVYAGSGADRITIDRGAAGYAGILVDGGAGDNDRLVFTRSGLGVTATVGTTPGAAGIEIRGVEYIELTDSADIVDVAAGYGFGVSLSGYGGADILRGGAMSDILDGGDGDDLLFGGDGGDVLQGGAGADRLEGGDGDDVLRGGAGDDILIGGAGIDTVHINNSGVAGALTIDLNLETAQDTGEGMDTFIGIENIVMGYQSGAYTLIGNAANNVLTGTRGHTLEGRGGDDQLTGTYLDGGDGDDDLTLLGGSEARGFGGDGDDRVYARDGVMDGGAGIDLLVVGIYGAVTQAINFDAATSTSVATGGGASLVFSNFERFQLSGSTLNDVLRGGAYADSLSGGGGDDQIFGLGGDDILRGGAGADILDGGDGDDEIWNEAGDDTLLGGAGVDTLVLSNLSEVGVTVDLSLTTRQQTGLGFDLISGFENVRGSWWNDVITGDAGANRLEGDDGDDILSGGAGDDHLIGGFGADTLIGGDGDDLIEADSQDLGIHGGAGVDTVVYNGSIATVVTDQGGGVYRIAGGPTLTGVERIRFNDGVLYLAPTIQGTAGADMITGTIGADLMVGLDGDDVLFGHDGMDTLEGGEGNDTLVGNQQIFVEERDKLYGGAGDDLIYGERADIIDGGAGYDRLIAVNAYDWSLDLAATSIEYAVMDFGNDVVDGRGQTVAVSVFAGGGNDTVYGSAFADLLFGGVGDDVIRGGDGDDAIVGDLGADQLYGGDGNDRIYFDRDDTVVFGGAGYDAGYITQAATAGGVSIDLAAASLEFIQDFAGGDDVIDGAGLAQGFSAYVGGGADTVTGSSFDDVLWGEAGDDVLSGFAGNDVLVGGAGSDRLRGGAGVDRLYGGAGDGVRDTFVFEHTGLANRDFIYEFETANDRIDLSAFGGAGFGDVSITVSGGNSTVSLNGQVVCVVVGVTTLNAAHFVFAASGAPEAPLVQPAMEDGPWILPEPIQALADTALRVLAVDDAYRDYAFTA